MGGVYFGGTQREREGGIGHKADQQRERIKVSLEVVEIRGQSNGKLCL